VCFFGFIVDIYVTCLMINYNYLTGKDPEFINHKVLYFYIIFVQIIETLINFVTINSKEHRCSIKMVMYDYVTGPFLFDLIGLLPYHSFANKFIFIRFIRLIKFKQYHKQFDLHVIELTQHCLSSTI